MAVCFYKIEQYFSLLAKYLDKIDFSFYPQIFHNHISLIIYFVQRKKAKSAAQGFIRKIEEIQRQKVETSKVIEISSTPQINDETVQKILDKLNNFEEKQRFLKPDITLIKLAKDVGTNTAYLSSVINNLKNCSFADYINSLRINYIISYIINSDYEIIKNLSLETCAEKAGYSNLTTFSRAFQKYTKIKPTVFLKELRYNKDLKSA